MHVLDPSLELLLCFIYHCFIYINIYQHNITNLFVIAEFHKIFK